MNPDENPIVALLRFLDWATRTPLRALLVLLAICAAAVLMYGVRHFLRWLFN